jgi:hypothetical protein
LNDNVAPVAIWYGGMAMELGAILGFVLLARVLRTQGREREAGVSLGNP